METGTTYFDLETIHIRILSCVRSEPEVSFKKLASFFTDVPQQDLTAQAKRLVEAGILNRVSEQKLAIIENIKILPLAERAAGQAVAAPGKANGAQSPAKAKAGAKSAEPIPAKTKAVAPKAAKPKSPASKSAEAPVAEDKPRSAPAPAPIALAGTARKALEIIVVTGGVRDTDVAKAYPDIKNPKMHLKRVAEAIDRLSELGLVRNGDLGGRQYIEATEKGEAQAFLLRAKSPFEEDDVLRQRIADHDHLTSADSLR